MSVSAEGSGNSARGQYADNSGMCDIPNCGNGPVETVMVTASRTYSANINLELTFVFGVAFNFGIYYNHDFLDYGQSPIGLYASKSQTLGLAVGGSVQFGRTSGPFGKFTGDSNSASLNWGAGFLSGSVSMDEAGRVVAGSVGPGTGLKFGFSVSGGHTWTTPVALPDKLDTFLQRGLIPDF